MPAHWLLIPYEENEWVEERMAGCIRLAIAALAEEYVWTRVMASRSLVAAPGQELAEEQSVDTSGLSYGILNEKRIQVHQEAVEQYSV